MRKLLLIPLLALTAGCVTYSYPVAETAGGVYYADEEPQYAYADRGYVDYSIGYDSVGYYPWWSLDYLYLGSGYFGAGYNLGIGFGYPTYYPFYEFTYYPRYYPAWAWDPWFYSPWYAPRYYNAYYHFGYPRYYNAYWHHRYRAYQDRHHRRDDRYARRTPYGDSGTWRRSRDRDRMRDPDGGLSPPRDAAPGGPGAGSRSSHGSMSRRVSVAPTGVSRDRGMVIRNRDNAKSRPSRIEPAGSASAAVTAAGSSAAMNRAARARQLEYATVRRDRGEIRYRAEPKQRISRAGPVEVQDRNLSTGYRAGPLPRADRRGRAIAETRGDGMTVRSASGGKARQSTVQPVRPAAVRQPGSPGVAVYAPPSHAPPPVRSASAQRGTWSAPRAPVRSAGSHAGAPKMGAARTARPSARGSSLRTGDRERRRD
jgi:hypothetical protein